MMRRLIAACLLGAVLGSWGLMTVTAREIENLRVDIRDLQSQLESLQEEKQELKKDLEARSWISVREASIMVNYPDDSVRLALEETLRPTLKRYIGRNARELDPVALYHLFDGREFDINGNRYRISVLTVLISDRLVFYLNVEKGPPAES